jgi:adenosine deaminase
VKRLADERIPLTMCPLSNRRLRVTPDLARNSFIASFADARAVTAGVAAIDDVLDDQLANEGEPQ